MTVLRVVLIIAALILITICTMSSAKSQGAGSTFGGSSNDNYFSKNKNQSKDAKLDLLMKASAIVFIILSIAMVVLQ